MTNRQFLLDFMKEKNEIIISYTGITLFDPVDFNEIEKVWNDNDIEFTVRSMITESFINDSYICPWCVDIIGTGSCKDCSYGRRHGICTRNQNIYSQVIDKLKKESYNTISAIREIPEIHELCEKYYNLYFD